MFIQVLIAVGVLGGMGAILGGVLAAASQLFATDAEVQLERLIEALPGANCGACGYPGCAAYAQAVLDGKAPIGGCPVGKAPVADKMREIMGTSLDTQKI